MIYVWREHCQMEISEHRRLKFWFVSRILFGISIVLRQEEKIPLTFQKSRYIFSYALFERLNIKLCVSVSLVVISLFGWRFFFNLLGWISCKTFCLLYSSQITASNLSVYVYLKESFQALSYFITNKKRQFILVTEFIICDTYNNQLWTF